MRTALTLILTLFIAIQGHPTSAEPAHESRVTRVPLTVTAHDGVRLTGLLHLPEQPEAVVILIHGSEPGRKEGYREMVATLVRDDIAALTWDKRGAGESGGEYVEAPDLSIPAKDVSAWVTLLQAHQELDTVPLGVLGWSQGGWIGPLAATLHDSIRFVVMISGPAVSPLEQNIYDKSNRFRAQVADPERAKLFEETIRALWTYLTTGEGREEASRLWETVADQDWFIQNYQGPPFGERESLLRHPRMAHYVAHNGYDPLPVLRSLRVPLLALFGSDDRIVPVARSVQLIEEALGDLATVRIFPGADHQIRIRTSGGRGVATGLHETITGWIENVLDPPD